MSLRLVLASAIVTIVFKSIQTELSDGSLLGTHQAVNHDIERRAVGDCGGTFYSDSGQFSSPGYPGYYNNKQECIYVIFIPRNDALILLEFDTFNTEPKHDVVRIYDGLSLTGTLIGEYSGTSIPPAVLSTGNVLTVTFTSDFSATRPGFLANYTAFTNARDRVFISDYGSFSVHDWFIDGNLDTYFVIIVSQGYKVKADMQIVDHHCQLLDIMAYDGVSQTDALLATFHYHCVHWETVSVTSTGQSLYVQIYLDVGLMFEIYVDYHAVEFGSNEGTTQWQWAWDATVNPWNYTTVQNELGSCGGNYTNDEGSFASPSYPGYYPGQQDCYYCITVSAGNQIVLDIEEFDTEVCCDFVEVFDGDSKSATTSMGKYFGSNVEAEIKSTGRSLFVHFHSDHSKNHRGFYATYGLQLEENESNTVIIVAGAIGAASAVLIVVMAIIVYCCVKKKLPALPAPSR
ncbi:bone morphogenetic protein 1-like isoform X3 [Ptychodera flava]|uniref:bone morphogenetic protein 1-like isoform X3 n=1 Tax=Ptychodera flava TaxID=63121 RepID=UPI00396A2449